MLATIGVWHDRRDHLLDYLLDTYVLPRTERTAADWARVTQLAAELTGRTDPAVPVRYLGLFDSVTVPGAGRSAAPTICPTWPPYGTPWRSTAVTSVSASEPSKRSGSAAPTATWPGRRAPAGRWPTSRWTGCSTARWVRVRLRGGCRLLSPTEFDALAGSSHPLSMRKLPEDARVHASVELYVRAHPQYWRRLPARIEWADAEWLARGERLVQPAAPLPVAPAAPRELAAAGR